MTPHAIDLCNGGGLECTRSEEVAELRGGGIDEATPSRMPRIYKGWTSGVSSSCHLASTLTTSDISGLALLAWTPAIIR